nr:hypothetical protein CFP56_13389 [Quercus suber]
MIRAVAWGNAWGREAYNRTGESTEWPKSHSVAIARLTLLDMLSSSSDQVRQITRAIHCAALCSRWLHHILHVESIQDSACRIIHDLIGYGR